MLERLQKELALLVQLGRLRMTIFSAVTYSCAYTLALHFENRKEAEVSFDKVEFLWGWAFVLFCQLHAHFMGEYYDYDADRLNNNDSPFTGGSRVLLQGGYSLRRCWILGCLCFFLAFGILIWILPTRVLSVGIAMILLASQYSGVPLRLNHRCFGEITAALVMNALLPYYSAVLASPSFQRGTLIPFFDERLSLLVLPAALVKFALFLVLNLADKRSDWLADKITLPVKLGDRKTAILHALTMASAYGSCVILYLRGNGTFLSFILIMMTAPIGLSISRTLLSGNYPFYITPISKRSLQHAPLPLLAVFVDCFVNEALSSPSIVTHIFSLSFQIRCLPIYPYLYSLLAPRPPQKPSATPKDVPLEEQRVIIAGGGVAGLILALCLRKLKIPFVLVEKRDYLYEDDGADLGLWPSSIHILKELGLNDTNFWHNSSYTVEKVHMIKLPDASVKSEEEDIMKIVDMGVVVSGSGENFRLIGRRQLMGKLQELLSLQQSSNFMFSTSLLSIRERSNGVTVTVRTRDGVEQELEGRLLVGSDGINSLCRKIIATGKTQEDIRYSGEVCYRGVTDLEKDHKSLTDLFLKNEKAKPHTMSIYYGTGIRASWGFINEACTKGFWWIKVKSEKEEVNNIDVSTWPQPLKLLYESTEKSQLYLHPVQDRVPSNKWCSSRTVLVGDAAHPVTPNMGQGANMAIEDAFVLAILLSRYASYRDGHQEAFYQYYHSRNTHSSTVAAESYQQSKMGQWTNPLLVKFRELVLRKIPSTVLQNKLKKVNMWAVRGWIEEFQKQIHSVDVSSK